SESGVSGAGHRVLIDTRSGRKETRDEIELGTLGTRRYNDATHRNFAQRAVVGRHSAQSLFGIDFHQVIERVSRYRKRLYAEGGQQIGRRFGGRGNLHGKVEFDPI